MHIPGTHHQKLSFLGGSRKPIWQRVCSLFPVPLYVLSPPRFLILCLAISINSFWSSLAMLNPAMTQSLLSCSSTLCMEAVAAAPVNAFCFPFLPSLPLLQVFYLSNCLIFVASPLMTNLSSLPHVEVVTLSSVCSVYIWLRSLQECNSPIQL